MNIWKKTLQLLKENKKIIFLKVVFHKGSSPGKQGFNMIVADDGFLFGSIGGGRTEFQLVEEAKKMLLNNKSETILIKQVHRESDVNSSGMICSGEQWVVLKPLDRFYFNEIQKISEKNKGSISFTKDELVFNENDIYDFYQFDYLSELDWKFEEKINQKFLLYLIGGGHVGLATAKICQDLDFEIMMFDDREGLNTFEQNEFCSFKKIIDYQNITNFIQEGNHTYIVILTHNYASDGQVLKSLEGLDVKYIGVLGSNSKIKSMFKSLKKEGVSDAFINTVDAPIGIQIKSITPAEIAISIAAKLISIKNKS